MSVFVIQQPKPGPRNFTYDISPCLKFGQPEYVFSPTDQPGLTPGPSLRQAEKMLADFNPDTDHVLWAGGDPYGLALVSSLLSDRFGTFSFLRWERERGEDNMRTGRGYYVSVRLNVRRKAVPVV